MNRQVLLVGYEAKLPVTLKLERNSAKMTGVTVNVGN